MKLYEQFPMGQTLMARQVVLSRVGLVTSGAVISGALPLHSPVQRRFSTGGDDGLVIFNAALQVTPNGHVCLVVPLAGSVILFIFKLEVDSFLFF